MQKSEASFQCGPSFTRILVFPAQIRIQTIRTQPVPNFLAPLEQNNFQMNHIFSAASVAQSIIYSCFFVSTCTVDGGEKNEHKQNLMAICVFAGGSVISTTIITLMCLACSRYYRITTHKRIGIWGSQAFEHHWRY